MRNRARDGVGDATDVDLVGGDDGVVAADCSLDDREVHDVVVAGLARERANLAGLLLSHGFHVTERQQSCEAGLPCATAPGLREHRGRHRWDDFFGEQPGVQRPHAAVVPFRGDERARVVGDSAHR